MHGRSVDDGHSPPSGGRHVKGGNDQKTSPSTITVGAGDLIGARPLVSALFHEEPTIEALNSIGFDVSGVKNHEFDEGVDELERMQYTVFRSCTQPLGGDVDIDAFAGHLGAHKPVPAPPPNRIEKVG